MANAASALGQHIGKLFEAELLNILGQVVEVGNHQVRAERLVNGSENEYQIDAVVRDENDRPVILLDFKFIRYTKHNRDKASWLCTAHYNLRKTYPSLRKSIAVLAGRWSNPSIHLMKSFGIEIISVPFDHMMNVLDEYGVQADWEEGDTVGPKQALENYEKLPDAARAEIASRLTETIRGDLEKSVREVIETDWETSSSHISSVEVLVRTDRNEMRLFQYSSAAESVKGLTEFITDVDSVNFDD